MNVLKRKTAQNVRYGEQRHGFFMLIKPLLVLLCVGVLYFIYANWQGWLEKLDNKPISAFALAGAPQFTTYTDVRDVILEMGDLKGYFGQDVDLIRAKIESLPWIKGAIVRKIWPDRLSIWVTEYQPAAIWNDTQLVSPQGEIFKLPFDKLKNPNLPQLSGPDFQSQVVLAAWSQIFRELRAKNLSLKSVGVDERGSWQIVLDNDVLLKLGRGEWTKKIERFVTIYPQIEVPEHKKLSYVDLRYNVGAAVGFVDDINAVE
ncbi:cell division protein FtsQ/DivIB [Conservatibacter flavescens]|uniref:Cell division protein FtsQ n=1 Tax=Conservatibacter flavescens TaxID=28161 RepID=A0A2M8S339_9PAST|nr:cell division protein FtsQ/DivIB [Conservatibacter flavescens]PJG85563.1 cell division protein FtsQ [Conservatibacter flavescens]